MNYHLEDRLKKELCGYTYANIRASLSDHVGIQVQENTVVDQYLSYEITIWGVVGAIQLTGDLVITISSTYARSIMITVAILQKKRQEPCWLRVLVKSRRVVPNFSNHAYGACFKPYRDLSKQQTSTEEGGNKQGRGDINISSFILPCKTHFSHSYKELTVLSKQQWPCQYVL